MALCYVGCKGALMQDIEILYCDEEIVVVNKPGGLLSVPGRGPEKLDSVTTRLKTRFPSMIRQPAVHRLDMFTSGLMVYAISKEAHRHLSMQFADRTTSKKYLALLEGGIDREKGEIRLAFRLDVDNRPYQVLDPEHGKTGVSYWRKLASAAGITAVEFQPVTGRTHQLRLHAAHPLGLNAPILGDSLYGSGEDGDQMMLHASELTFLHPNKGATMHFRSTPPFTMDIFA